MSTLRANNAVINMILVIIIQITYQIVIAASHCGKSVENRTQVHYDF